MSAVKLFCNFGIKKRLLGINMPEINLFDLKNVADHVREGENMITVLREEMKLLMAMAQEKHEQKRKDILENENKKLQTEIDLVKKELIELQVANGVPQIPVPGDGVELKSKSPKLSVEKSESKHVNASNETPSNETKAAKPPKAVKSKKESATAADEPPLDVGRLDIRVGRILNAKVHPDADQLYVEQIDVGDQASRTVVSGLVKHVPLAELNEKMVVVLCNLKPQKMRGVLSEGMVLCASTPEKVELLTPPADAKAGDNITVPGYPHNPDLPFMNPKKKIFEKVAEDLKVNSKKEACYKDIPWVIEGKPGPITAQALSGCFIK